MDSYRSEEKYRRRENTSEMYEYKHSFEDSRYYHEEMRQHTNENRGVNSRDSGHSYGHRNSSSERDTYRSQDQYRRYDHGRNSMSRRQNDNNYRAQNDRSHYDWHTSYNNDVNRFNNSDSDRRHHEKRQRFNDSCSPIGKANEPHRGHYDWGKIEKRIKDRRRIIEQNKPKFTLSGKLSEAANIYKVIQYSEPAEARIPKRQWRLYPFKGEKEMAPFYVHKQSCYLIGRDHSEADLPVDHPSCSKQHAALQYRLVTFQKDDGTIGKRIRPYLIDLESANGTFVNNKKIDPRKYVELLQGDVIKLGFSSREYVLLNENSKDGCQDDDVGSGDDVKDIVIKKEKK